MMTTNISLLLRRCYYNGTIVLDTQTVPTYKQYFALNHLLQLVDIKYHGVKFFNLQKHTEDRKKGKIISSYYS